MTLPLASLPRQARGFFLSDAMILTAATALSIALAGLWRRELEGELPTFFRSGSPTAARARLAGYALAGMIPATLAALAIRLWPRRQRLWLIARQPGAIACLSASLAVAGQTIALPLDLRTMGDFTSPFLVAAFYWPTTIAVVVLVAWLLLAVGRRWRPEGDWVDRLGMLAGIGWIGLPLALAVVEFL